MSSPIEGYGLIGDGQTIALVNRDGSVDWLCWPRFDSDACLAALLGDERHGCWSFSPKAKVMGRSRRYEEDTLILRADAVVECGAYRITDFMSIRDGDLSSLVRVVEGLSGTVELDMVLKLRFAYGTMPPWCETTDRGITAKIGPDQVGVDAPVKVHLDNDVAKATFTVVVGERLAFVLSYSSLMDNASASAAMGVPERDDRIDPEKAVADTRAHWHDWIGRFDAASTRWPEVVKRSLITSRPCSITSPAGSWRRRPPACRSFPAAKWLALSLVLAPRRLLHAWRLHQCGFRRGSDGLARLAAARGRRRARHDADHVPARRGPASQ